VRITLPLGHDTSIWSSAAVLRKPLRPRTPRRITSVIEFTASGVSPWRILSGFEGRRCRGVGFKGVGVRASGVRGVGGCRGNSEQNAVLRKSHAVGRRQPRERTASAARTLAPERVSIASVQTGSIASRRTIHPAAGQAVEYLLGRQLANARAIVFTRFPGVAERSHHLPRAQSCRRRTAVTAAICS